MSAPLSKQRLRVWLRLLRAHRKVENTLREQMRLTYDCTLPRFDVLSALDRHRDGLRMSDLSAMLMVSNGNVTGIVDRLASEGLVERITVDGDRRAMRVRLTADYERLEFLRVLRSHANEVITDPGSLIAPAQIGPPAPSEAAEASQ